MRIYEHITFREQRDIFWAEPRVSGKHPNHAKFASEFTRDFGREITVQLNAANSSDVRGLPNVLGIPVNENADCISISRQCLDNLPGNVGFNVARTSRVEVKANQRSAQLHARFGISRIRDAADFDLHRIHGGLDKAGAA